MQKYKTIVDAIALAEFAHRNQVDKAGLPYIEHPKRVLEKVRAQGALPYVQMAAILHDVTEDTAWRLSYLSDDTRKRLELKYAKARAILDPPPVNYGFISTPL